MEVRIIAQLTKSEEFNLYISTKLNLNHFFVVANIFTPNFKLKLLKFKQKQYHFYKKAYYKC